MCVFVWEWEITAITVQPMQLVLSQRKFNVSPIDDTDHDHVVVIVVRIFDVFQTTTSTTANLSTFERFTEKVLIRQS